MSSHYSQVLIPSVIYEPIKGKVQSASPPTQLPVNMMASSQEYSNFFGSIASNISHEITSFVRHVPDAAEKAIAKNPDVVAKALRGQVTPHGLMSMTKDIGKASHKKNVGSKLENNPQKEAKTILVSDFSIDVINSMSKHGPKGYQQTIKDSVLRAPYAGVAAVSYCFAPTIGQEIAPEQHPVIQNTGGAIVSATLGSIAKAGLDTIIGNKCFVGTLAKGAPKMPMVIGAAAIAAGYKSASEMAEQEQTTPQQIAVDAVKSGVKSMADKFSNFKTTFQKNMQESQQTTAVNTKTSTSDSTPTYESPKMR